MVGRETLHRLAVPPDERFGTESGRPGPPDAEPQGHLPIRPLDGDLSTDAEPGRVPGRSPGPTYGKGS